MKNENFEINSNKIKENNQMITKKRLRDENNNDQNISRVLLIENNKKEDSLNLSFSSNTSQKINTDCPYLGTIKRHMLDFDFEKVCSLSLSNLNVYACLVCGKYYQGRGKNTYAYTHSLEEDHHMFINLHDQRIFCLPDAYEVIDNSLNDIKFNLKPIFSKKEIDNLEKSYNISKALDGTEFIPGCIGLNNIKRTDYVNVIIQAMCRVVNFRKFFLEYEDDTTDLVRNF